jgi:hypothetical protein
MNLSQIRQKYPQYNDLSDEKLADSYHQKYYSDLPKEEFYSKIGFKNTKQSMPENEESHPFRDIIIGLTHAGRNLHNLPHDIVQSAENAGESFGNKINFPLPKEVQEKLDSMPKHKQFKLSEHLPNDINDYADVFGQKGEGTLLDQIIQKGTEYSPELIGGGALIRGGFRRLKGTHQLDKLEKLIKQKGIKGFNYPKQMINESKKFLPQTNATKELLAEANAGNYKPAFNLQSQVGHHERALSKSPLPADYSIMAPKARELKQNMVGHLEKILRSQNLNEEADLLKTGIKNYGQYKRFMKVAVPVVKYLGIPTTIFAGIPYAYKKANEAFDY